jgi:REP element-mobilizing transposase RayT
MPRRNHPIGNTLPMRFAVPGADWDMPLLPPARTKWCHVTLATYRRQQLFKIAATARFCEHLVARTCADEGWRVDAIAVRADAVHVLLEVPRTLPRDRIVRRLRVAAARAIHRDRICSGGRRVFETGHWFAVLADGARVATVRRHLQALGGTPVLPPAPAGQ